MTATGRSALRTLAWAAAVGASAAAGWFARGAAPLPSAAGATAMAAAASPLIKVAHDGRAALHLVQHVADGMVEQTATQPLLRTAQAPATAAAMHAADDPNAVPSEAGCSQLVTNADALLHTIAQGRDEERADALLQARVAGVPVPDALLRELIDTAISDRIRLAAVESWLEARVGDPAAERAAIMSLIAVPNTAVQHDLRRRIAELDEMERIEALAVHGAAQRP